MKSTRYVVEGLVLAEVDDTVVVVDSVVTAVVGVDNVVGISSVDNKNMQSQCWI